MNRLVSISEDLLHYCNTNFTRFLYNDISLKNNLTGIVGGKGVGKTTLLLQLMKNKLSKETKTLYVSLQDFYFASNSLLNFAKDFYRRGGIYLFLDDLHKYTRAFDDLKNIRTEIPGLYIVYSSSFSSGDDNSSGTLARDHVIHKLPGLSYREFLEFKHQYAFPLIQFDELTELNRNPGAVVLNRIRPLQYFEEYLREGYYPIFRNSDWHFSHKLMDFLCNNIEQDLPVFYNIDYQSVGKIRKLLFEIAQVGPFKPNVEELAGKAGTTRDSLLKFFSFLGEAGLILSMKDSEKSKKYSTKPQRLYLNNSNLIHTISSSQPSNSAVFETFLINQLQYNHSTHHAGEGVLIIDEEYRFNLEWRKASSQKTTSSTESYSINDGIDYQSGLRIPLWMFGFLY